MTNLILPDTRSASAEATSTVIDVVILTWNDGELLDAAIQSALAAGDVDVRVIVVDNGSQPPAMVPDDPRVTLIRNDTNLGVSARNQGVEAGSSAWVCLLDSDARLHADTLSAMVAHGDDPVGLISPVFDGQRPEASGGRAPGVVRKAARALGITSRYGSTRPNDRAHVWEVEFTIAACQLIRRSAFEAIGGLDTTIFYGPEDIDFCLRLREAGWQAIQTSDAGCHHPPRRRNRQLFTRRGIAHSVAVVKHLRRHRNAQRLSSFTQTAR